MQSSFLRFIQHQQLLPAHAPTLLTVSGGIDSVVMAHLFHQTNLPFAMAHCNFGLRGADSDQDEAWVRALAKRYQVPFYTQRFDTLAHAHAQGVSIQMAARALRYAWFRTLCQEHGFAKVATAHHSNDSLETVLLHLTKGTGIAGLKGIPPAQGRYIRPLLFASKADIIQYAKDQDLSWREDSSNQKDDYQRNLIRNQVVPQLQKINPNLEATLRVTVERLHQVGMLFDEQATALRQQLCRQQGDNYYVAVRPLQGKPWAPVMLWELLKPWGFHFATLQELLAHTPAPGTTIQSPSHCLYVDRGQWIITARTAPDASAVYALDTSTSSLALHPHTLHCAQVPRGQHQLSPRKNIAALDHAKLHFPLTVRKWQPGDTFCPLGMQQHKKLSDFLIDNKVPRPLKAHVWVVTSQEKIVWVVGHRIDDRFKVTEATRLIYQLSIT